MPKNNFYLQEIAEHYTGEDMRGTDNQLLKEIAEFLASGAPPPPPGEFDPASPGPIGGTTPGTGVFTTLNATDGATIGGSTIDDLGQAVLTALTVNNETTLNILTVTGQAMFQGDGALSAPAETLTGTWITGGTTTTTKPHFLIEPTGTTSTGWSTSGTGLGVNAPSGFTGNVIDAQLNGTFLFRLSNVGDIALNGTRRISTSGTLYLQNSGAMIFDGAVQLNSTLSWSTDTFVVRDAANTLAQRNGTAAQTLRLYNTYTDASNYERLNIEWGGGIASIYTSKAGTGSIRSLRFGVDGTNRWEISQSAHLLTTVDNTYDIGASGATRPRTGYFGTSLFVGAAKVIGVQGAAVADATDNPTAITQLNALLARLRAHGLIAT